MTSVAEHIDLVTGGIDTHKELNVAAVVDRVGRIMATKEFATTTDGHRALLRWFRGHGELARVGVEGTGAYGAGITRFLSAAGIEIVEVDRPNRQVRRRRGKSDTVDAEAAARAALNGEASGTPKTRAGEVEAIRALRVARRSALKARSQATNQLHALVLTAPDELRTRLRALPPAQLIAAAARLRSRSANPALAGNKTAMAAIARRCQFLTVEIEALDTELTELVGRVAPQLVTRLGVGTDTAGALLVAAGDNPQRLRSEASFAALCGVSPIEASSGQHQRHRLNRGGNREANNALWRIVLVRMAHDPRTRHYVARRTTEGRTKKEIMRCLKRYVAREIYADLLTPKK